jgi:hypothetical protein
MMLHRFATNHKPARFFPGDLVEVRSSAEILSTLDEKGTLENLPFMPEMLCFSGRQFRISRQAFKTCVDDQEMRKLENTVFLEDLRCDGKSHGGCAKACLIFWKEAWLKPVGSSTSTKGSANPKLKPSDLVTLASRDGQFFCQSSEILNASSPLPFWQPKQYLWDLTHNRVSFLQWVKSLLIAVYNKIAHVGGFRSWGFVAGPGTQNGTRVSLSLQTGDRVRVKSLAQIKETLDADGKHQHLLFAPAMAEFCGREMRVQNRVDKIILEGTPRQREIKDTVLLEGATCDGICHRMCPRQSLLFWRECWLEKVNGN